MGYIGVSIFILVLGFCVGVGGGLYRRVYFWFLLLGFGLGSVARSKKQEEA